MTPLLTTIRAAMGASSSLWEATTIAASGREHSFTVRAVSIQDAMTQIGNSFPTDSIISIAWVDPARHKEAVTA
jgi:hypothetical protein